MKMSLEATGISELSSFHLRRVADRAVAASASYADVIVLAENIKIDTVIPNSQCFGVLQIFSVCSTLRGEFEKQQLKLSLWRSPS